MEDLTAGRLFEEVRNVVRQIRAKRADHLIDKKIKLIGGLSQAAEEQEQVEATERLANVSLGNERPAGEGWEFGTLHFRIWIQPPVISRPRVDDTKLLKENVELEKVIANSKRQLGDAQVIAKMPEKVVETLRAKLAEYEAKLQKNLDALASE